MLRRKAPPTRYANYNGILPPPNNNKISFSFLPYPILLLHLVVQIHWKQIRMEEQLAFSDWINTNLGDDKDLKHLLPIGSTGRSLFEKVKDGILLW